MSGKFRLVSGKCQGILFCQVCMNPENFNLLIHVKMPTIVGILTFISMINGLKARNFFICLYLSFNEQLKLFGAQLS